ncbi:LuxR C-terminal-related transcriptional regulator [Leifsonia sp. NPDC058194]|uniref:LuxR C-terminal-related transcriptional regulator n=1 Tax=Leifsonia sp. NPDC058194 TaxID=3346374 RepID=UPI0036DC7816
MPTCPHPALAPEDRPEAVAARARRANGTLVAVSGLAGVGKSTWLRQFAAASDRLRVVSVSADAFESSFPFALADKLAHAAGVRLGVLGDAGVPALLAVARVLLPALARGTSASRRLALVIDNAQWIDEPSVQALRFVLGRIAHDGVCVVLAGHAPRTDEIAAALVDAEPGAWDDVRRIVLEPLDAAGVREYISRVHDAEVSLRLASRIRELSGGLPVLLDAVVGAMERSADGRRTHWDEDVRLPHQPENPFRSAGADQPAAVIAAVEICAALRDAIGTNELAAIADALHERIDVEAAVSAGLLVRADADTVRAFHDLYATDVRARLAPERRSAILTTAAGVLDNPHRALICRLDAASGRDTGARDPGALDTGALDADLLSAVRARAAEAARDGHPERAVDYLRRAADLADGTLRGELVVEACVLAGAAFVSPVVLDLLPELEGLPRDPVRDLAVLQTRQITGDVEWAVAFAAELAEQESGHPDAETLRMHAAMMAVMVQLTTDDYGPVLALLDRTRAVAEDLLARPRDLADRRLAPLPSAEEIRLRATGLAIVAAARIGDGDRVAAELGALSIAIASAADSPALSDALTCRAGVLAGIGGVDAAAADLERALALASRGVIGWSLGHARVLLAYCWWVQGRPVEAAGMLEDAAVAALDSIDVSSRPLVYLLRAVLAAEAGDGDAYETNRRVARDVTVTDYDTFGVELELLAAVQQARSAGRPEEVVAALSPEAIGARWLAGSAIFTYRVEALAELGRAEEADRELTRLRALAGTGWSPIYGSLEWLEGRVAEAFDLTEQAVRSYRAAAGHGSPRSRAQVALDAGRLLLRHGDRRAGERMLRSAADGFRVLGARPALLRALALLDGDEEGADPAHPDGLETLSGREREVAQLAARGLTNAEIADALFLSAPTVAFHMRKVLAKLGLRSRRELGGVLPSGA